MAYRNHRTRDDYHEIFCNECGREEGKFYESDDEQRWICLDCLLELPGSGDDEDEDESDEEDAA